MSRQNYRRRYLNQPQDTFSGDNSAAIGFPNYGPPYLYPNHSFEYYSVPYPSNPIFQPADYWYSGGLGYANHHTELTDPSSAYPSYSGTKTLFSPDAPEFVSKQTQHANEGKTETVINEPKQNPLPNKKKKKKKKKITMDTSKVNQIVDSSNGEEDKIQSILCKSNEQKTSDPKKSDHTKSVRFQESSLDVKKNIEKKSANIANTYNSAVKETSVSHAWPKPASVANTSRESQNKQPKMSFADKLKTAAPVKSPFLDWRDQRTNIGVAGSEIRPNASTVTAKIKTNNMEKPVEKLVIPKAAEVSSSEDGFITISRKKSNNKPKETTIPENSRISSSAVTNKDNGKSTEIDAKKKLEKEKKKLREKERKKRVREERILAERLAPKGQKVTIITTKLMEQFLQSGRKLNASNKSVIQLNEDMFPVLGKRDSGLKSNVSESESEWETTEIEVVQKEQTVTQRNVKRSDPIQFDLMALITKKNTKKKAKASESLKRNKNRPGLVANVLDRSAPTLSRGKIRNKKRKLSEIRKALITAKAKKKELRESQVSTNPSSGARPHALHSKKFREYCDQILTDQIDLFARDMLYHLRTFQDRVYKKDPIKARMKKRLVAGLREVTKQVERNRVKIIFLAPDIQRCPETGGLDEAVKRLLDTARRMDLPIVYALSRRKIGRVLLKKVPVSCVGILNYQATEETWKQLTEAVNVAREEYQLKLQQLGLADVSEKQIEIDTSNDLEVLTDVAKPAQTDVLLSLMKLSMKEGP